MRLPLKLLSVPIDDLSDCPKKYSSKIFMEQPGWYLPGMGQGHVLVTEFQGMALNGLFCADVLRPLDFVLLTDFTYKYHPVNIIVLMIILLVLVTVTMSC